MQNTPLNQPLKITPISISFYKKIIAKSYFGMNIYAKNGYAVIKPMAVHELNLKEDDFISLGVNGNRWFFSVSNEKDINAIRLRPDKKRGPASALRLNLGRKLAEKMLSDLKVTQGHIIVFSEDISMHNGIVWRELLTKRK